MITHHRQAGEPSISDSMFHMLRCIIAVAQADGMIQDGELEYLKRVFADMERDFGLTAEQRMLLGEDMLRTGRIAEFLPRVTDPADRRQLFYLGGIMAQASGELHPGEEEILKKIGAGQLGSAEVDRLLSGIKQVLVDKAFHDALAAGKVPPQGVLRTIIRAVLAKLGVAPAV